MSPAQKLRFGFIDSWHKHAHQGSGTSVAIGGLLSRLKKHGHRIRLFSPKKQGPFLTLSRVIFNFQTLPQLLKEPTDVMVGFDMDGFVYSWLRNRNQPYLVSIKGVLADEAGFEKGITKRLLQAQSFLERFNLKGCDGVITTSEYSKNRLHELYGLSKNKIRVVPEGIDLTAWTKDLKAALRKKRKSEVTILCVAKQYPRKRVLLLIRAFSLLKKKFPNARLRIVGDGPDHKRLKEECKKLNLDEVLLGSLPSHSSLVREYANADIFCLPSVQEGFGIVFLEAMAAGLPIVACRVAAVPEIVHDGKNGLLAKPDNVDDLARQLEKLLLSRTFRQRLGAYGRKYVSQFDWKKVIREFLNIPR